MNFNFIDTDFEDISTLATENLSDLSQSSDIMIQTHEIDIFEQIENEVRSISKNFLGPQFEQIVLKKLKEAQIRADRLENEALNRIYGHKEKEPFEMDIFSTGVQDIRKKLNGKGISYHVVTAKTNANPRNPCVLVGEVVLGPHRLDEKMNQLQRNLNIVKQGFKAQNVTPKLIGMIVVNGGPTDLQRFVEKSGIETKYMDFLCQFEEFYVVHIIYMSIDTINKVRNMTSEESGDALQQLQQRTGQTMKEERKSKEEQVMNEEDITREDQRLSKREEELKGRMGALQKSLEEHQKSYKEVRSKRLRLAEMKEKLKGVKEWRQVQKKESQRDKEREKRAEDTRAKQNRLISEKVQKTIATKSDVSGTQYLHSNFGKQDPLSGEESIEKKLNTPLMDLSKGK